MSSDVPRDGWLNRCDECHHEREDGSLRVALPQGHIRGSSDSGEWAPWSNSEILQLWLIWRNILFCPSYGKVQSVHATTMSDINPGVFKEFKVTLPHQRHRKEIFTSVTIVTFFYLLTFKKKRRTQAQGVTDTVTPWESTSEYCWARCPWLFISLLNYSCYPWWPRSPRNNFTAWLLLQGHRWSYMHYLWSHAVLSDFALMQAIMPVWL